MLPECLPSLKKKKEKEKKNKVGGGGLRQKGVSDHSA